MTPEDLKKRTKAFALRCIKLVGSFPNGITADVVGRQLIKAASSVAANYSACCAARSHADFLNKLGIVEEETDESVFWIDFAVDAGLAKRQLIGDLITEGGEILAIVIASQKTAKVRRAKNPQKKRASSKS